MGITPVRSVFVKLDQSQLEFLVTLSTVVRNENIDFIEKVRIYWTSDRVSSQTMWIKSLVVVRQNVPITFIHSETTLS